MLARLLGRAPSRRRRQINLVWSSPARHATCRDPTPIGDRNPRGVEGSQKRQHRGAGPGGPAPITQIDNGIDTTVHTE